MQLTVRITRPAKTGSRVIPCWPTTSDGVNQIKELFIGSLAFDGDPNIFTVGTTVTGECEIRLGEELKSYAEKGSKELVPRFALDSDGLPIVKDGKDAVLVQGWLKWKSGTYDRAMPSEEALKPAHG